MDPNSSLGKICLGDDVVVILSDKCEGSGDSPEYQETAGTYDGEINLAFDENLISNKFAIKLCLDYEMKKGKKLVKKELIVALRGELYFVKFIINPEEDDFEPGVILGRSFLRLAKGVIDFGNGVTTIYPEPDPFEDDSEKTGKSSDDWDQLLDFSFDDVPKFGEELPPFICKMGKRNHNKKRAMENLNLFYQDIGPSSSAGGHLTQEEAAKEALVELDGKTVKEDKEAVKRIKGEALKEKDDPGAFIFPIRLEGKVNENALADTGFDVLRIAESDSDDEEEYAIKRNKFGAPIYGPEPAPYLNCTNLKDRSLAIQTVTNPFRKISVCKKAVSFLGSLPVSLKHVNWKPDHKGCYTNEEEATRQWRTEIRLTDPYGNIYLQGCSREAKSRYNTKLAQLLPRHIYSPCDVNWDVLNQMGCDGEIDDMLRIRLREAESDEEIFTLVAWIRSFNINKPIYAELCHEFYSTYEFDEVCVDDELESKKIIKFRLGGRAHNLTLLEFAQRMGLYQAVELEEEGFNESYFYYQEPNFEGDPQNDHLWFVSKDDWFISKLARKCRVLTKDVVRSLSALIYCRDLDMITLRDLIDSEGKLIPEDPQPGVPRVGIPRPPRASMQDLYDRMGRMEIRQDAIERMEYRHVPLQGAYNPPGYAQPQYDQYYQQYQPPPPPQQQQDDDE
ncbi:hypothetical protein Tco_1354052 [Tanacetum coccineum]